MARKTSKPEGTPEPRKTSESRKHTGVSRLAPDIIEDARMLASLTDIVMAEYLSDIIRPVLRKDLDAALEKRKRDRSKEK